MDKWSEHLVLVIGLSYVPLFVIIVIRVGRHRVSCWGGNLPQESDLTKGRSRSLALFDKHSLKRALHTQILLLLFPVCWKRSSSSLLPLIPWFVFSQPRQSIISLIAFSSWWHIYILLMNSEPQNEWIIIWMLFLVFLVRRISRPQKLQPTWQGSTKHLQSGAPKRDICWFISPSNYNGFIMGL